MQKFIKFIKIAIPAMLMIAATIFLFAILVFRPLWVQSILSVLGIILLGLIVSVGMLALGTHFGKKIQFEQQQNVVSTLNARHVKAFADQKAAYEASLEAERQHHSKVIAELETAHGVQLSNLGKKFSELIDEEEHLVNELEALDASGSADEA